MNKQCFQVNVEMATPACSERCPNLQIDVEDLNFTADNIDDYYKLRQIRCVNDSYCRNLHRAFEKNKEANNQ